MKTDNFKKDLSISGIGQIIVIVLTFIINKSISIILGPNLYSEYAIINKSSAVVSFVMAMSLGIAIPKYIASQKALSDDIGVFHYLFAALQIVLVFSLLVIVIILSLSSNFADLFFNSDNIGYLYGLLIFAFGTTISTIISAYYRGIDAYVVFTSLQVFGTVMGIIPLVFVRQSITQYFIVRGIGLIFISIILYHRIFKKYMGLLIGTRSISIDKSIYQKLLVFSLPRIPGEFILFSLSALPLIIINRRFGNYATASLATSLGLVGSITPFFSIIGTMLLPYVSKSVALGTTSLMQKRVTILILLYIILAGISILLIYTIPKFFIYILFSSEYYQFANEVRIISISTLFQSLYLLLRNPIDAVSKIPFNTFNLIVTFIILIFVLTILDNLTAICWGINFAFMILGLNSLITWKLISRKLKIE